MQEVLGIEGFLFGSYMHDTKEGHGLATSFTYKLGVQAKAEQPESSATLNGEPPKPSTPQALMMESVGILSVLFATSDLPIP